MDDWKKFADEREKLLMDLEELQGVDMPWEKLADIRREIERRARRKRRVPLRVMIAVAALVVLLAGVGMVGSGKRVYVPVVFQRDRGVEVTSKVNNEEAIVSGFDEEEVCQAIEQRLGMLPVRLTYQPKNMKLIRSSIDEVGKEAIVDYGDENYHLHIYISKDYGKSTINMQTDGKLLDTVTIEFCDIEIPVYIFDNREEGEYYCSEFEYLNTYYTISGKMEEQEFIKILENILIKNV